MNSVLDKVNKLLSLATGSVGGEEARTAALLAARLIVSNKLLTHPHAATPAEKPPAAARSPKELRPIVNRLLRDLISVAEAERESGALITVANVIDWAVETELLSESERSKSTMMLANLARQERRKGVLSSIRGRNGGYKIATISRPESKAANL